ncbi:hypothetical protein ABMA28_007591 [Loxostege sticticalis]|uniref:CCHC-type domain-containing protein n=1 Tax=Loxostege sticticalis TaxID=481309 RepID=A0ABD0SI24_LOXSC
MSSTTSNSQLLQPIEKLRGSENYSNWKFLMKMILIHEELWCYVENTGNVDTEVNKQKSQKALAKICLSVQPAVFSHVRNAQTPHEAWNNLKKAFEDSGLCRRLGLLRSVFATKLNECDGMEGYLNKITSLSQQLQDINAPLDDEFVAVIMLSGLTSDYDPLIMALENSNLKLTSDVVKGKLLQEYQRRDEKTETAAALVARKQPKCFKCKKVGHFIKDCPKKNFKPKETACSKALISAMSVNVRSDVWYIDSGATSHMCNNRDIIQNFVEEKPKDVNVANGEKLQTAGRGNVQMILLEKLLFISSSQKMKSLSISRLLKHWLKIKLTEK